jgi:Integrase core domain
MKNDVRLYNQSCPFCQCSKPHRSGKMGLLKPVTVPRAPGLDFAIDIVSGLPPLGKCLAVSLAVLVDRFSGYVFAKIFIDYPTSKSLFAFVKESCLPVFYSLPKSILSDRGPQFLSLDWKNFLSASGTRLVLTSGYRPESNGLAERMIQNLVQTLGVKCIQNETFDWRDSINDSVFSINNSPISSMGYFPSKFSLVLLLFAI